jgi:hypothetical protein
VLEQRLAHDRQLVRALAQVLQIHQADFAKKARQKKGELETQRTARFQLRLHQLDVVRVVPDEEHRMVEHDEVAEPAVP